jgi:biopolymer transport protein TolQ
MHLALAAAGITQLLSHSGWVAKSVLLILLTFSIFSWAVMLDRFLTYRRNLTRSRDFYQALRNATKVSELMVTAKNAKDCPVKELFVETYRELHEQVKPQPGAEQAPDVRPQVRHADNLERTLQRVMTDQMVKMETGMAFLATTASATPFIGLFGTVWGIMDAFQAIGQAGSATLASVAPGISEALITTAAGLFAAVPALIGYNLLGRKIKAYRMYMEQFSLDLINFLMNRFG